MPTIEIITHIKAEPKVVFDLSRNIDFHQQSTKQTNEQAIGGRTSGLINYGEFVTWKAKHFGIYQYFTSKISAFKSPTFFVDEMTAGAFKSFKHEHHFLKTAEGTEMKDMIHFQSPFGCIGFLVDRIFLKSYLSKFVKRRNQLIKLVAENT